MTRLAALATASGTSSRVPICSSQARSPARLPGTNVCHDDDPTSPIAVTVAIHRSSLPGLVVDFEALARVENSEGRQLSASRRAAVSGSYQRMAAPTHNV